MEIISALGGALGGLTGPIFGWLKSRSDNKHEESMAKIRIQEIKAEADAAVKVAVEHTKGKVAEGELAGWQASYKDASTALSAGQKLPGWASGLLGLADFIRGILRPFVVLVSLAATIAPMMGADQPPEVMKWIALTSIGWLFGERGAAKALGQLK